MVPNKTGPLGIAIVPAAVVRKGRSAAYAHTLHMPCTCRAHAVHMPCTCRAYAVHMPCTCRAHAVHMPCACRAHAVHIPWRGAIRHADNERRAADVVHHSREGEHLLHIPCNISICYMHVCI
eukprot:scaffold13878_cov66-Phaeocystis_antarctica.AAC.3